MPDLNLEIPLGDNPNPEALQETVTYAKRLIKDRTPVDTGNLKRRWQVNPSGSGIEVSNSAEYATFVEYGTKKMTPRHMVSDVIPDIQEYYQRQAALRDRISQRKAERSQYRKDPGVPKAIAAVANQLASAIADRLLTTRKTAESGAALDLRIDIDAILGRYET